MVRCEIILEVMENERLVENAAEVGLHLLRRLEETEARFPEKLSNARGRGLLCAFDCTSREDRDRLLLKAREKRLLIPPCGETSIRLRPPLNVSREEVDEAAARLTEALKA